MLIVTVSWKTLFGYYHLTNDIITPTFKRDKFYESVICTWCLL